MGQSLNTTDRSSYGTFQLRVPRLKKPPRFPDELAEATSLALLEPFTTMPAGATAAWLAALDPLGSGLPPRLSGTWTVGGGGPNGRGPSGTESGCA